MEKPFLLLLLMMLSMVASAHDIAVKNNDGVTIYYVWTNDKTELAVSFEGEFLDLDYTDYDYYSGNVAIPASVTYNGSTYSVTSIESYTFYSCSRLKSVTIPNSVKSIGGSTFYNCSGLTSVTIGNSVTSIGEYAFYGCSSLKSVTIPNSVTSIGASAFRNCSGLTSVTIGNSVTSIGAYAFSGCTSLSTVKVPVTDYSAFCSNKALGCINSSIGKPVQLIDNEGKEITRYIVPDGVTSIGSSAFRNCTGITGITIAGSVTSIGKYAFSGCSSLNTVSVPVTDYSTFCNNKALECISSSIGKPVQLIDTEKKEITEYIVPDGVTSIGSSAFRNCTGITGITIAGSVTSIGASAFSGCSSLNTVKVPVIDYSTFCSNKTLGCISSSIGKPVQLIDSEGKVIVEYIVPDDVTSIGSSAFRNCTGITGITIAGSVTSIGASAFSGCSSLNTVKVPVIDYSTFCSNKTLGCISSSIGKPVQLIDSERKEITEYIVPDGVTLIGSSAFRNCKSLTSMTIANSVTSIASNAFSGCSGLTSVTIPNSVTSIGASAFSGCTSLNTVKVPVTDYSAFCNNKALGCISSSIGKPVQLIDSERKEITEYIVPDGVASIRSNAFRNCTGLTAITIANSVKSIGGSTFYNCSGLTSVTIGNRVTSIGGSTFYNCSGLTSVVIGNRVTSIEDSTFYNCRGLTSITIPNSVTSIGVSAFSGCRGLTSVTIGNSVTSIGASAFSGCTSLSTVKVPVTDYSAFCSNKALGCINSSIGKPVQLIDNEGKEITRYIVPDGVTSIGSSAFLNCTGLTAITIAGSLTSIGNNAFSSCTSIMTVKSYIAEPYNVTGLFSNATYRKGSLYVPAGTKELYIRFDGWREFLKIEEMDDSPTPDPNPNGEVCVTPTISYQDGKLTFLCATEGATCHYLITDNDIKAGSGNEVQLGVTYNISVYAAKEGFENSETATATLCWIEATPQADGIANGVAQIAARPVLVKSDNGFITVEGADERTYISIYTTDGKQVGSAISQNNAATISTNIRPGSIVIVKIGEKSVKVVVK